MLPEKIQKKIWSRQSAPEKILAVRKEGKKTVFTNGVFDILHAGHVSYLTEAAALGNFLIVGLNSDESAKRLEKSPARPLQNAISRAAVLAGLEAIDAVVIFDEDTPYQLISELLPNILVKGGDYNIDEIAGSDVVLQHGGQVLTLHFLPGYSTTAIEKKIIEAHR